MADQIHETLAEPAELDVPARPQPSAWHSLSVRMAAFLTFLYVVSVPLRSLLPLPGPAGVVAAIALDTLLCMAVVYYMCRLALPLLAELGAAIAFAGMWALFSFVFTDVMAASSHDVSGLFAQVCLLYGAAFLGRLAARPLSGVNILLPLIVAAAVFDAAYVFAGPTRHLIATRPELLSTMSLHIHLFGAAAQAAPQIGAGDLLLLALLFAAGHRFGLNLRPTFWVTLVLVFASLLVAAVPLPGLVPIAAGFLACNYRAFSFTREERLAMLVAGITLALALPLILVGYNWLVH